MEASNENLDLQNQKVLQSALLDSKDNFLNYGFISWDHKYKQLAKDDDGTTKEISDPKYLIGEPVDIFTDGKSTIPSLSLRFCRGS